MTIARYALGAGSLAVAWGSIAIAAVALRARLLPSFSGAIARLAEAVLALALMITMLELLGAAGLFRLGPILVAAVLVAGLTVRLAGPPPRRPRRHARAAGGAALAIGLTVTAVVVAAWAGPTLSSYEFGIRGFDSLWYHLPWAASFAQTGHVTPLRFTDVEYLTAFYPASAELLHGLGIVLLGRDTLSPGINLIWLVLCLLAAYCVGRPRGLGHATLLGAAVALSAPAITLSQAGSAANDVAGVFFLLAAVALVANAQDGGPALALAGVSAGLALGTKLSLAGPVLALTIGVLAIAPHGHRRHTALLWLVPLLLAGGFWYLRNLIAVGNPLPWVSIPGLPTPAPALQQHTAFSIAHYATDTHIWRSAFGPGLRSGFGNWWPALVIAAFLGPLLCLWRGAGRTLRMLALVALASLLAYIVTPETAAGPAGDPIGFAFNLRYVVPGLTLALTLLPLAPPLSATSPARWITLLALGVLLVAMLASGQLWPGRQLLGAIGVGAAVLLLAWLLVRGLPRLAPATAGALLVVLLLAAAAGGYPWQRRYLDRRYVFQPGVAYIARLWDRFRSIHSAPVALVGTYGAFFAFPLYGLDASNRVQYVAHRGAHGSFTPIHTCQEWRAALNSGHYRYLVTTPGRDPWQKKKLMPSPEFGWTVSDPAAQLLYSRRADHQRLALFQLRGRLSPAACPP